MARYDYRNLPDSVSAPIETVYRYDADGQRVFKSHEDGYVEFGYQEYYVRGIDGTVLAVYRRQESHFPIELWYWNIVAGSEIIGRAIPD